MLALVFRSLSSLCGPGCTPHGAAFWGEVVPQEGGKEDKCREAAAGILRRDGGQGRDLLGAGERDLPQRLHPVLLVMPLCPAMPTFSPQLAGPRGHVASGASLGWTWVGPGWKPRLPWLLSGKESACNAGTTRDTGLIPGLGRSPGEGNGYPFQYSCLGNSMDRGAWQAIVHRVAKSWTRLKWLSMHTWARNSDLSFSEFWGERLGLSEAPKT